MHVDVVMTYFVQGQNYLDHGISEKCVDDQFLL